MNLHGCIRALVVVVGYLASTPAVDGQLQSRFSPTLAPEFLANQPDQVQHVDVATSENSGNLMTRRNQGNDSVFEVPGVVLQFPNPAILQQTTTGLSAEFDSLLRSESDQATSEILTAPDPQSLGQATEEDVEEEADSVPKMRLTAQQTISGASTSLNSNLFGAFRGRSRNGLPPPEHLWFSTEALFGEYGDSNSLIGDERAPDAFAERFQAVNLGVLDGAHVGLSELDPSLIGQQVVNDHVNGFRLRAGYRNTADGGLEADGTWMSESERSWQRGLGGLNAGADPTTVRVTAALPLFDGSDGYAVPYDQHFRVAITTETNMYGVHYAPSGFWWGAVLIQPAISVRYMNLDEAFGFSAADSGLTYEHNADGTPVESTLDPPVAAVPPYQTTLASNGETTLVGPLLGLQYATSGQKLRISGSTRVGLLHADSTQTLAGQGFGNGFAAGFDPTASFGTSRSTTYATGVFEQQLNLDIEIMRLLPPFNKVETRSSLVLRLGWSIVALNDVVRPVDAIQWNGFPLTPGLTGTRNDWYLQTWSAGAIFQY